MARAWSIHAVVVIVALGAGCGRLAFDPTLDSSSSCVDATCSVSGTYRRRITLDNSRSAVDLIDFPLLVKLDATRIDYGKVQNAGQDLRFATGSEPTVALRHQIEQWDETGASYVWVKVPRIAAGSTTDYLWMYYGDPAASDGQDARNVWDTYFVGVYHLSDAAGTAIDDSTDTAEGARSAGGPVPTTGHIAGAQDFSMDWVTMPDRTAQQMDQNKSMTFEAWVKPNTVTGLGNIARYDDYDSVDGDTPSTRILWLFRLDNGAGELVYGPYFGNTSSILAPSTISLGMFHHVVAVRDVTADTEAIYVDGSLVLGEADTTSGMWATTGQYMVLGRFLSGALVEYFDGIIDEVRISDVARSADWIEAEYQNGIDAFASFGPEEMQP